MGSTASQPSEDESGFRKVVQAVLLAHQSGDAEAVARAHLAVDAYEELSGAHAQARAFRQIADGQIDADLLDGMSEDDVVVTRTLLELIERSERPAILIAFAYFGDPHDRLDADELLTEMESQPGSRRLAGVLRRISQGQIGADMLTHLSDGDAAVVRDVFEQIEWLRRGR